VRRPRGAAHSRMSYVTVGVLLSALVACSAASQPVASTSGTGVGASITGTLQIDAAASLKKTFDELAAQFRKDHPAVNVSVSYDGSSVLATQILGGAPVDVFASADGKNMEKVISAKLITGKPTEFATNTLQIAVQPGNPRKITGLADLAHPGLTLDLCAAAQPCGAAAEKALAAAGVTATPISREQNVTAVLLKVESGDADAGLVYRTDVLAAGGKVQGIDFPEARQALNAYPIAALDHASNPSAAAAFVTLVTGPVGRKVLAQAGFGSPRS